jgi:hypothetical protein
MSIHEQLRAYRFQPNDLDWKIVTDKGAKALVAPYADPRLYQDVLDALAPGWESEFLPWGSESVICRLTVDGVIRSEVGVGGEHDASNQAFRKACCAHGLSRYLWSLPRQWVQLENGKIPPATLPKLRAALGGEDDPLAKLRRHFHALGTELYGDSWDDVRRRNNLRVSGGQVEHTADLSEEMLQKLIAGLEKLKRQRSAA